MGGLFLIQEWKWVIVMLIIVALVITTVGGTLYFSISKERFLQASEEYKKNGDLGASYRARAEAMYVVALNIFLGILCAALMTILIVISSTR